MNCVSLAELFPDHVSGYWGRDAGTQGVDARVIRNSDVLRSGDVRWDELPVRSFSGKEMAKAEVRAGDLLLTTSGDCGRVALAKEVSTPSIASNFVRLLRPDPERTDPRFLWHQMRTTRFRAALQPFIRGTTMDNLSVGPAFSNVELVVPPIEEQRRIAAVLDAADGLRAKRRAALAELDTLTQAIFLDMFVRDGGAFERSPIGDLAAPGKNTIRTGPFGSQLLHEEFTEEGIAVLGIDNAVQNRFAWGQRRFITPAKYEQLKRYTVRPGDVLVTIMATTGRVAVVPDDIPTAINTKHLCCITLDQSRCLPEFLWAAIRFHPTVRQDLGATHGAVMPGLNMGKIKGAQVPVPPLDLQSQFVKKKEAVERQASRSVQSADELEALFASLQQRAFRGEL